MNYSSVKVIENGEIIEKVVVKSETKEINRKVDILIGKELVIKPLNKKKLKNRDRRVLITKFIEDPQYGVRVQVKYLDTNRSGKVEITDLDDVK